jgi:hypothetical protein
MILLLFGFGKADALPLHSRAEIETIVQTAKPNRQIYILILFKPPRDLNLASAAFRRFIGAIPSCTNPYLGVLIDPSVSHNQVLYSDGSGVPITERFQYRRMLNNYNESITLGVTHQVDLRLRALLDLVRDQDPQTPDESLQTWKDWYKSKGANTDLTSAVNELVRIKRDERVKITLDAIRLQTGLDRRLAAVNGRLSESGEKWIHDFDEPDVPLKNESLEVLKAKWRSVIENHPKVPRHRGDMDAILDSRGRQ